MPEKGNGRSPDEKREPERTVIGRFADAIKSLSTKRNSGYQRRVQAFTQIPKVQEANINNYLATYEVAASYSFAVPLHIAYFQERGTEADRKYPTTMFVLALDDPDPANHKVKRVKHNFQNFPLSAVVGFDEAILADTRPTDEQLLKDDLIKQIDTIDGIDS